MNADDRERPRVLIAGIGNIFLGDDAFGVEVVRRLAGRDWPETVRIVDFGIRGFHLALALLEPYTAVILVDALPRGGEPGTLYVLEAELDAAPSSESLLEMHSLDPVKILRLAAMMGAPPQRLLVVGCEPTPTAEDMHGGLSKPVQAAVDEAIRTIDTLVPQILSVTSLAV